MSWLLKWNFIKLILKDVIKRAIGELNNNFQDEFNKILSLFQNMSLFLSRNWIHRMKLKNRVKNIHIWPCVSAMF